MEQPKLVIASVLKPVTDTRMCDKIGRSISQAKKYEVNIIGFYRKNLVSETNIKFHPIFDFPRLSLQRVFSGIKYLSKLRELRPSCIICSTHELLIPTVLYSFFCSTKVIYDVRENYFRNILYTDAFPLVIRFPIALWVRLKEYLTRPFISKYLLAEKCYRNELLFAKNKNIIIENKAIQSGDKPASNKSLDHDIIQLIFTGTIATTTGVFDCIELAKSLHQSNNSIRLKIIGYCAQKDVLSSLRNTINNFKFIELIGGEFLVDHITIIQHIKDADFGLVYYPPNKANDSSIPTKLYEYLGHQLPMIMENKMIYTQLCNRYPASINIDFRQYNASEILRKMQNTSFYKIAPKNEVLWASEELKLLSVI